MQFKNYMEKLFGNKAKVEMLRAFYKVPEKVWTSRDLAKFIGTYNSTILRNLGDFEEIGLLQVGMHGHVKMIHLNKESFVFKEIIKPLFEKERKTFDSLIETLKKNISHRDAKFLALFGSVAEGKEKPNSDIDLLIVTEKKEKIEADVEEVTIEVAREYGNEISAKIFSPKEFRAKQGSPFIREAKKNHIAIYGSWE